MAPSVAVGVLVAAVWLLLLAVVEASDITNPTMTLSEVHGLEHLVQEGDILILIRYELPQSEWRIDQGDVDVGSESHAFLDEADCVDNDQSDPLDNCWTSVISGVAAQHFYDGPNATANLIGQRTLPRIGHGLSAVYIGAGHSLTFGTATYEACLIGSATLFTPSTTECDAILWHAVTDDDGDGALIDDARVTNATVLRDLSLNLQDAMPISSGLLNTNGLVTPVGAIYNIEAYSNMVRAAPTAFAGAEVATSLSEDFVISSTPTAAEQTIQTDAQASRMWGYVNDFNDNHFAGNLTVHLVGGVFVGMLALFIFVVIWGFAQSLLLSVIVASLFIFGFGVLNDLFDFKLYLLALLLFFGLGAYKFAKGIF